MKRKILAAAVCLAIIALAGAVLLPFLMALTSH